MLNSAQRPSLTGYPFSYVFTAYFTYIPDDVSVLEGHVSPQRPDTPAYVMPSERFSLPRLEGSEKRRHSIHNIPIVILDEDEFDKEEDKGNLNSLPPVPEIGKALHLSPRRDVCVFFLTFYFLCIRERAGRYLNVSVVCVCVRARVCVCVCVRACASSCKCLSVYVCARLAQ